MNGITHTLGGPTLWGTIEWLLTVIKAHWVTSAIIFWGWGITRNLTRNEFNSMFGTLVNRHGKKNNTKCAIVVVIVIAFLKNFNIICKLAAATTVGLYLRIWEIPGMLPRYFFIFALRKFSVVYKRQRSKTKVKSLWLAFLLSFWVYIGKTSLRLNRGGKRGVFKSK